MATMKIDKTIQPGDLVRLKEDSNSYFMVVGAIKDCRCQVAWFDSDSELKVAHLYLAQLVKVETKKAR